MIAKLTAENLRKTSPQRAKSKKSRVFAPRISHRKTVRFAAAQAAQQEAAGGVKKAHRFHSQCCLLLARCFFFLTGLLLWLRWLCKAGKNDERSCFFFQSGAVSRFFRIFFSIIFSFQSKCRVMSKVTHKVTSKFTQNITVSCCFVQVSHPKNSGPPES